MRRPRRRRRHLQPGSRHSLCWPRRRGYPGYRRRPQRPGRRIPGRPRRHSRRNRRITYGTAGARDAGVPGQACFAIPARSRNPWWAGTSPPPAACRPAAGVWSRRRCRLCRHYRRRPRRRPATGTVRIHQARCPSVMSPEAAITRRPAAGHRHGNAGRHLDIGEINLATLPPSTAPHRRPELSASRWRGARVKGNRVPGHGEIAQRTVADIRSPARLSRREGEHVGIVGPIRILGSQVRPA